jgi:hypothetical protein
MWKEPKMRSRLEAASTVGKPGGGSDAGTSVRDATAALMRSIGGIPSKLSASEAVT